MELKYLNMASHEDESSSDSSEICSELSLIVKRNGPRSKFPSLDSKKNSIDSINVVSKLNNRQIYGRVTRNPNSKTEPIFNDINNKCRFVLEDLLPNEEAYVHNYMGFTVCGRFFISYREIMSESLSPSIDYELYMWKFVPGKPFIFVTKHRIFKLLKDSVLEDIVFLQHPADPYKLYCYGVVYGSPGMAVLTILTLPLQDSCKVCNENVRQIDDSLAQGWCLTHGFMLHYMFTMACPIPKFNPNVSLAYPDYLVINTGHYIHILNTSCYKPSTPPMPLFTNLPRDDDIKTHLMTDNMSEVSETASDNFSANSIVEAILEDFSEYDLEGNDYSKPFHELNISCEPLNVTGKSYNNTYDSNVFDSRIKRIQSKDYCFPMPQCSNSQKNNDKPKIDRKIAEKAYEFTEENEKCEKLSSFRKRRLADKKYEFSEDNSENIVPFNSLRRERRFLYKSKGIKSSDLNMGLFLSPRSSGIRSPMQSPNSRNGQFSPAGRHICCPSFRNSPHHSKSPISPRESARKVNVYSPSMDSDCSDYDSKLILRQINNFPPSYINDHRVQQSLGLLIVDSKKDEASKWIKKVVRRYSSVDFENGSLVSGQSRDDYNIPIEIPIIVQTLSDQHLDVVPEFKADQVLETQLIVTQRSFDCEQFVQIRAQRLCAEHQLQFLYCEDYDIKLLYICPLGGYIVCQAVIKIGAIKLCETNVPRKQHLYVTSCMFTWNIESDAFELFEPFEHLQLFSADKSNVGLNIPYVNTKEVHIMDINSNTPKYTLRDYNNQYEIVMNKMEQESFYDSIENDF